MLSTAFFLFILAAIIQPRLTHEILSLGWKLTFLLIRLGLICLALLFIAVWMHHTIF